MHKLLNATEVDQKLEGSTVPEALRDLLKEAVRNLHNVERNLVREAEYMAEQATQLAANIRRGVHINELGEFQSAREANRLCALREERANHVKALQHTINEAYGTKVSAWVKTGECQHEQTVEL
jgi:hypothetical protein